MRYESGATGGDRGDAGVVTGRGDEDRRPSSPPPASWCLCHRVLPLVLRGHLGGDLGWRFRVAVESLAVGAAAVGDGMQRGRILVQLGFGNDGPHLGEPAVGL